MNMIMLQCPLCKGYYVTEVKTVKGAETILCPHCHRESDVYVVLNHGNKGVNVEQFLEEMKQFAENVSEVNVNEKIRQLFSKYHVAPVVIAYIVNCLLESYPSEDYPPLFVEYRPPQAINLSDYLVKLDRIVAKNRHSEPEISLSVHCPSALEIAYQRSIKELEQKNNKLQNEIDSVRNQIDSFNQQLIAKQDEINRLNDKIVFLQKKAQN